MRRSLFPPKLFRLGAPPPDHQLHPFPHLRSAPFSSKNCVRTSNTSLCSRLVLLSPLCRFSTLQQNHKNAQKSAEHAIVFFVSTMLIYNSSVVFVLFQFYKNELTHVIFTSSVPLLNFLVSTVNGLDFIFTSSKVHFPF